MGSPTKPNLFMPGNPRYQPEQLQEVFGYDNLFRAVAEVEIATLQTLGEIGVIPKRDMARLTPEVVERLLAIRTTEVDEVERQVTKHDIRAWVRLAQEIVDPSLRRWVHVPLTSYDALDTARALQFKRAHAVLSGPIRDVVVLLAHKAEIFAKQVQIGRTHGQHALPVTVGFWLATILQRVLSNVSVLDKAADSLTGKISGAVGAHNAQVGLGFAARVLGGKTFESMVLEKLGLRPALISTQILLPEPVAYYLFSCVMLSASLGQFGRDGRNLMRSEIGEVVESFEAGQVGSSTMAHKRNPINFENLEGTWLKTKNEFGKVLDTLITDHQRDLVGSPVYRDFPTILVNLQQQLNTLLRKNKQGVPFLARVSINEAACRRNFEQSAHLILAEPLYIALQMAGYEGDAHDLVNEQVVPMSQELKVSLVEVVAKMTDAAVQRAFANIPTEVVELLHSPERYIGDAVERTRSIIAKAYEYLRS